MEYNKNLRKEAKKMQNNNSEAMKNKDIKTIDSSEVADTENIKIDTTKTKQERIVSYINQTKNPYYLKCGRLIIKNSYLKTYATFTDKFKQILSNN